MPRLPAALGVGLMLTLMALAIIGGNTAESPDFELYALDGKPHKLSDYRGRWVVVNYWATWCPPCLEEMPELSAFYDRHLDQGVMVLGINLEEIEQQALEDFVDSLMVDYPILRSGMLPPEGMPPIRGLPTTHVVSPEGEIVATRLGGVTAALLEEIIRSAGGKLPESGSTTTTARILEPR
jgi:thiol-disulfide isomerase/thioredoxin